MKANTGFTVAKGVSFFLFFIIFAQGASLEPTYHKYVDEVHKQFGSEMLIENSYSPCVESGELAKDVKKISMTFNVFKKCSIAEAREMEVNAIERFQKLINQHTQLRPYLREYPFPSDRVGVSLWFCTEDRDYYADNAVATVFQANGKLYYSSYDPVQDKLIRVLIEPYEDALKIVNASQKQELTPLGD